MAAEAAFLGNRVFLRFQQIRAPLNVQDHSHQIGKALLVPKVVLAVRSVITLEAEMGAQVILLVHVLEVLGL